jgi:hypothetical protein
VFAQRLGIARRFGSDPIINSEEWSSSSRPPMNLKIA